MSVKVCLPDVFQMAATRSWGMPSVDSNPPRSDRKDFFQEVLSPSTVPPLHRSSVLDALACSSTELKRRQVIAFSAAFGSE
jgi:hypothetical protein